MGMLDFVRHGTRVKLLAGERVHWVSNSKRKSYIIAVILSAPPWVDRKALRGIQERARCLSEMTGVPHEIDHIVPLSHPRVCGLTVPWNLRIVTALQNGAKNNRWCPEQMELW